MNDKTNITLTKDILCYILKFLKINGVPLYDIHTLRNIYNSSKSIRQYMTNEQIITIESWKKYMQRQRKQLDRNHKAIQDYRRFFEHAPTHPLYLKCSVCFCKYPYLKGSVHQKEGCPLYTEFCRNHQGGTKLYPACMFDFKIDSKSCKICCNKNKEKK